MGQATEEYAVAQRSLEELLARMGFEAEVGGSESSEQIDLSIEGPDAGALVGNKGQTLDALQLLLNKIVGARGEPCKLVVVDSDGYRVRREASLVEMANRLSERALQERKIVRLNPMSARDRRVIHMTLRQVGGIETRSEGEGEERRLLIIPQ